MERTARGIRVTYFYSACVGIATPDVRVLCDPWFTPGAYHGSWYAFPELDDPLGTIGEVDLVWVSHIHPDHYDPVFLRRYLARHPSARVVIAPFEPNWLSRKMAADGIAHEVVGRLDVGGTRLALFLNGEGPPSSIDSALAVKHGDASVLNLNDCVFPEEQLERRHAAPELRAALWNALDFLGTVDIALLPYAGAGSWPQTYDLAPDALRAAAAWKKRRFLDQYLRMLRALEPRVAIPFAGKYVLGGSLAELNGSRGVADAVEAAALDPRSVVLADGGGASLDTETLAPTAVRTEPYGEELERHVAELASLPLDHERFFASLPVEEMPLRRLLALAHARARRWSRCERDLHLCLRLPDGWFTCNAKGGVEEHAFVPSVEHLRPRSELEVDPRLLFGLLTGVFHWNNAEVGSLYRTRRVPDEYDPDVQGYLTFLHV